MNLRQLDSSEIKISPVGLGCWQFSQGKSMVGKFWGVLTQETINSIVKVSLENGINWFDTAEAYGGGQSEQSLAIALKNASVKPQEAIVATKWMPAMRFASSITNTIDTRLQKLDGYPISLYQIHNPMSFSSVETQMNAMAALVHEKKIKAVGVSNFDMQQMRRANETLRKLGLSLASNQMRFNMLDRRIEKNGVLEYARDNQITIIAYSPLAQGILTGKFHENPDLIKSRPGFRRFMPGFQKAGIQKTQPLINELKAMADRYKVSIAQVALNWAINFHGDLIVVIPGASNVKQAQENAGVMKFTLTKDEMNKLDKISCEVIDA